MKKFLVILIAGLFALNVQAQWYSRSFGVDNINDLSQAQLNYALERAQSNVKIGRILTLSGVGAFTLGTFIAASSIVGFIDKWDSNDLDQYIAGGLLMLLGMGSTAAGIPIWILGATRKKKVEVALLRFNSSSITNYKLPQQFGLSLKVNF